MSYFASLKNLSQYGCLAVCLTACGSGGNNEGQTSSSSGQQSLGSHNAGQSCMSASCHDGNGVAEKFTVGGTLYKSGNSPQNNATVRLYIHLTNTLSIALTSDANGNFYSTEQVDGLSDGSGNLVTGVDVEIETINGFHTMPGLVTNGSCNSCHGVSNGKIVVN